MGAPVTAPPRATDGAGRLALLAHAAHLLTDAGSAAVRAADLLALAQDPHAETMQRALHRALGDLVRVRLLADARLGVVMALSRGDQSAADEAAVGLGDALAELKAREVAP